jgi:hypothetical protein
MGLTCSLLGHRFGDPVVEQDREDRGREAVTVTREVVVCERCGERRIRSESTEVAAVADPSDDHGGTGEAEHANAGIDTDTDAEPGDDTGSGPEPATGEPAARTDGDATAVEEAEPAAEDAPEPDLAAPEGEPTDEGAEILTEESETEERGFGEWPEAPDTTPEPTDGASDGGPDAAGGTSGEPEEAAPGDTADADTRTGTEPDPEAFEEAAGADDGPVRLACPDCGFSVAATGSPLRAGDACPDCSAAYLAERNE